MYESSIIEAFSFVVQKDKKNKYIVLKIFLQKYRQFHSYIYIKELI